MFKKYAFAFWFFTAGFYWVFLYTGPYAGGEDATKVSIVLTWISVLSTLTLLSKKVRHRVRANPSPVKWWVDTLFVFGAALVLAGAGYPILALLYFTHNLCFTYVNLKPLEK